MSISQHKIQIITSSTDKVPNKQTLDNDKHNNNSINNNEHNETNTLQMTSTNSTDEKDEIKGEPTELTRIKSLILTDEPRWFEDYYKTMEPLGEPGTFGMAFKCHKLTDNKTFYAVKQINKTKFYFKETKSILDNMKNEIDVMNLLSNHPNICTLHETYEDRNFLYLVLDFCEGGELFHKIDSLGQLTEKQTQIITKQLLSAIKYMQNHNIAHLDLKPDNILFINNNPDAQIKIIDFGEAQIIKNKQQINIKCGTPFYMAPEIIREIPYDPFAADIWSIGIIIFCMLFGFPPFHAEQENDIFDLIKQGFKNEILDGYGAWFPKHYPVSENAMNIISGMLTNNANKRLTIDECLNHPWIRGNIIEIPNKIPSAKNLFKTFSNAKRRTYTKNKLFLVKEDPINLDCFSESDYSDSDIEDKQDDFKFNIVGPDCGIIKKGYLQKEGKFFKKLKKRYFILTNNGMVSYYKNKDSSKPIHSFNILDYTQLIESTKYDCGMVLCTVERNWKFIASNNKQRNEWMNAFEQCVKRYKKNRKTPTQINDKKLIHKFFHKIHSSFDSTDSHIVMRSDSVNAKLDDEINKKTAQMILELNIPSEKRQSILNLDRQQKAELIQQHIFKKLDKQSVKNDESEREREPETMMNSDVNILNIVQHNKPMLDPFSLADQSFKINFNRKVTVQKNSIFYEKHEKIMNSLRDGVDSRMNVIRRDENVLQCVNGIFCFRKYKYIFKDNDNISFETLIECIEFMLSELWDNDYTQQLYDILMKKISISYKAKLFSVGIERKDRYYWAKKYNNCFVGNTAIDWIVNARLVKNTQDKRQSAIDLGNSFITKGFVKHVCDNHKFKDDKLYYVCNDEMIDKQCLIEDDNAIENYNVINNSKQKTVEYNDENKYNDNDNDNDNDNVEYDEFDDDNVSTLCMPSNSVDTDFDDRLVEGINNITEIQAETQHRDSMPLPLQSNNMENKPIISKCLKDNIYDNNNDDNDINEDNKVQQTKARESISNHIDYVPMNIESMYYIPTNFIDNVIPSKIMENNNINIDKNAMYDFVIKSLAINHKNGLKVNDKLMIYNLNVHCKYTRKDLYFVAKYQNKNGKYQWIIDGLCDKKDLKFDYNISNDMINRLPLPMVFKLDYLTKDIEKIILNSKDKIIQTEWNKIYIYNSKNNNRRMTLSLTNEEFIKSFEKSIENINEIELVPIIMFDENNRYYIEYIWIINIEKNASIGISFKYNHENKSVSVVGLHLDMTCIFKQHIITDPSHYCHHLEQFTSGITDLHIGNTNDDINKIKRLENKVKTLKEENNDLKEKITGNDMNLNRKRSGSSTYSTVITNYSRHGSVCDNISPTIYNSDSDTASDISIIT